MPESDKKKSKVLVCGSIAIDMLGSYDGSFADYQEKFPINALNFSLQLGDLRTSFGGCGMNITYGLTRLGVACIPLTAAGANFRDHYQTHLEKLGVNINHIAIDEDVAQCATAIVLSDLLGNQITGFFAGAATSPRRKLPSEIDEIDEICLAVLAPEDAPIMLRQARDLAARDIPILFDPGQGISEFSRNDARELIDLSAYVIANDHEWEIIQLNAELTEQDIVTEGRQVIVTRSEHGVDVLGKANGEIKTSHIPALKPNQILEVTGSGDAFRAGYVAGIINGLEPLECARIGSLVAIYNLENPETQTYDFSFEEFKSRYESAWGSPLNLPFPV